MSQAFKVLWLNLIQVEQIGWKKLYALKKLIETPGKRIKRRLTGYWAVVKKCGCPILISRVSRKI
jgi:hypothetical protein